MEKQKLLSKLALCSGLAVSILATITACTPPPPDGIKKLKEEMQDRKIKRVTAGAIQQNALLFGVTLTDSIINKFTKACLKLKTGQPCTALFAAIAAAQSTELKATVLRLPFDKTDTTLLDPKLKDLFLAYQYSKRQGQVLEPNVQKLSDTAFWVSKALTINSNNCLSCHTNDASGKALAVGSDLGIYAVRVTRQQIIRHIDIKSLKPK